MSGLGGFFAVARAVAWRQVYRTFTTPALITPALFPLFFFLAFAGGLSRVADVPEFDFAAGYTAFQYAWVLLQAVSFGGAFTGFAIAGDFESGFARRLFLAARRREGLVLGYLLASMIRVTFTATLITIVAFTFGMRVPGGVDIFGLYGLALLLNVAATLFGVGMAFLLRTQDAGPLIQFPIFAALFLSPVYVPQELLAGWIQTIAALNPITAILETGRGFLSGDPTGGALAFGIGLVLILIFLPWAFFGLRRAERAG